MEAQARILGFMGAWGIGNLENDDALDVISDLEEKGWASIQDTLRLPGSGYVEAPAASRVIAAAEVVAAQLGHGDKSTSAIEFPDPGPNSTELLQMRDLAMTALSRLVRDSELRQLWDDAGQLEAWERNVQDLSRRLRAAPRGVTSDGSRRRRARLVEGSCYAIPLPSSGFAIGVLTHMIGGKLPFGYFFGPRRLSVPGPEDIVTLAPDTAVLQAKFGRTEIDSNHWPLIGGIPKWDPVAWPTPPHTSGLAGHGMVWRVDYDRAAPKDKEVRLVKVAETHATGLPGDVLYGALALAKELDRRV